MNDEIKNPFERESENVVRNPFERKPFEIPPFAELSKSASEISEIKVVELKPIELKSIEIKPVEVKIVPPAQESEKAKILRDFGGLESNIPINSSYWR